MFLQTLYPYIILTIYEIKIYNFFTKQLNFDIVIKKSFKNEQCFLKKHYIL